MSPGILGGAQGAKSTGKTSRAEQQAELKALLEKGVQTTKSLNASLQQLSNILTQSGIEPTSSNVVQFIHQQGFDSVSPTLSQELTQLRTQEAAQRAAVETQITAHSPTPSDDASQASTVRAPSPKLVSKSEVAATQTRMKELKPKKGTTEEAPAWKASDDPKYAKQLQEQKENTPAYNSKTDPNYRSPASQSAKEITRNAIKNGRRGFV